MSQLYKRLINANMPVGEIVAVNRFILTVSGMPGVMLGSQVVTEAGDVGFVRSITDELVMIDLLTSETATVGGNVVMYREALTIAPSHALLGRVVDPLLRGLDGGAPLISKESYSVFAPAPSFSERVMLNQQLETGVTVVDTLFPIVMGQRIAIMGDSKSGKTSFAAQAAVNQARLGRVVIFVLIAKRKTDVEQLVDYLEANDTLKNTVLIVADSLTALPLAFLAPYAGAAVGEYFWHNDTDVVVIYDDLANHAKVYREMSLLADVSPGRESYPGDMFYRHSSLLERAGKLKSNQRSLSALPIMTTSNNDITSHLSTSLISITDGQIIFDTEEMQKGSTPPVNVGLSVSRVGGRAQESLQKALAQDIFTTLASYRQASEFAHFGQELPDQYRQALRLGERIKTFFNQLPNEFFSLPEQQVMLKTAFLAGENMLDMPAIKKAVKKAVNGALASETHANLAQKMVDKHTERHA
jgi:F-type H+-transporting ATPase subunit alpha